MYSTKTLNFSHFLFILPLLIIGITGLTIKGLYLVTKYIITNVSWDILLLAIADTFLEPIQNLDYLYHNIRVYTQQLFIKAEVIDLDYFK